MSTKDQKVPTGRPDVQQAGDVVAGSVKTATTLFSLDLLLKHDAPGGHDVSALPSMTIVNGGDGKTAAPGADEPLVKNQRSSQIVAWTPAVGKFPDAPSKALHHFKPFKLPNGQIENTGYIPDSAADIAKANGEGPALGAWQAEGSGHRMSAKGDLAKWTSAPLTNVADIAPADASASRGDAPYSFAPAGEAHADAVAPSVQQVADSSQPAAPDQVIINSGAGSRAQLFNRGPRVEQPVTIPTGAAPSEAPAQAPPEPPADAPRLQPYSGLGSRARLFRDQPRS
jgi:hypothetical protein